MPAFIVFGRFLFAVLFIYSGVTKLLGVQTTADMLTAKVTIPDVIAPYTQQIETFAAMPFMQLLAIAIGSFEILAGLMIAFNLLARFFAILLIIFMCFAIFYLHDFWNQPAPDNAKTLIDALKDLSLIGALFIIAGYGRGPRKNDPTYGDV
ncbi:MULTISPECIES: DoxX family protein [unclassified Bradyrhizobium]|uniref:DoxX family protein n=1 Tax=unclassified Bradyrhizobium TaxID=2631580 RepID=UPI002479CB96|nr:MULTISPECIES: DoxX family protein [unclassified Bradyrhizobium]WGR92370.1 DoxX family protein [Bradyrhizobium sp. ISRA435]WGR96715.1 DoxX family protein [Bradyrhizobium sp. ISRA436]WGS03602.1 DoxX family protein [Bradyrhizobium sp. ISRA437]WGS10486.1 DoxX family protein [Bradyrhizobium sp. ISRA443]WGS17670.1 DoxX family protein [Bradyrhizobium sp. ISRA463]